MNKTPAAFDVLNKAGLSGQASVSLFSLFRAPRAANGEVSLHTSLQDTNGRPHFTTGGLKVRGSRRKSFIDPAGQEGEEQMTLM